MLRGASNRGTSSASVLDVTRMRIMYQQCAMNDTAWENHSITLADGGECRILWTNNVEEKNLTQQKGNEV